MKSNSEAAATGNKMKKIKKPNPKAKFFLTMIKVFFILGIICTFVGGSIMAGVVYGWIKTADPVTPNMLELKNFATIVYDSEGNELNYVFNENRIWVDFDQIPEKLVKAFIAIEDERFYSHTGIDLRRIAGVTLDLITKRKVTGGASTITQQVIRGITKETEVTLQRKIVEQWRALQLEKVVEKNAILEVYMNLIYLGQGANGVQTAAKVYFNKDVSELTLSECAVIAGITNWPEEYDPFKNLEASKNRRDLILGKMLELGYIEQAEYDTAIKEEIKTNRGLVKQSSIMSYFVEEAIADVKEDLMKEKKMSSAEAQSLIDSGGLRIYTTMDPQIQEVVDDVFKNHEDEYFPDYVKRGAVKAGTVKDPRCEAAMVIIEPETGEVKAIAGGRGEKEGNLVFNLATQQKRQPGSTMKPIGVYAPLLESGQVTAATVFEDLPLYLNGYHPTNYGYDYQGLTSVRQAIMQSTNIVAVKAWLRLGPDASHDFLVNKLGISSIRTDKNDPQNDRNPAMALGGITDGITPLEMTAAYMPFANRGVMIKPITYKKVTNAAGKPILTNKPQGKVVMSEANAYIMTSMLQDVVNPGTAWQARFNSGATNGMASAGKTGTTNDLKDKWFIGYTPYYLAGVWYGYSPTPVPFPEEGQQIKIWGDVMKKVHELKKLPVKKFEEPSGIVRVQVCKDSGKLPGPYCSEDPRNSDPDPYWHRIREEIFAKGTEPKSICDVHVKVKVCKDSGLLATDACPKDSVEERVMIKGEQLDPKAKGENAKYWDLRFRVPTESCNMHTPQNTPPTTVPSQGGATPGRPSQGRLPGSTSPTPSPSARPGFPGTQPRTATPSPGTGSSLPSTAPTGTGTTLQPSSSVPIPAERP